jgi:hypothetical protein
LLAVEPRGNRFGDTWLVNQAAFVAEQTLDPEVGLGVPRRILWP